MIEIPLRTGNGQNNREHWRVAAKRAKSEREAVMLFLGQRQKLPCTVTVTRVAPSNGLDAHDNLRGALKHVVDAIATRLGVPDNDPRIDWQYGQERGPWGVRIDFSN